MRFFVFALAGVVGCKSPPPPTPKAPPLIAEIDAALQKGANFLLSVQGKDGGWHSKQYPFFKDGRPLSPIILSSLYFAPPDKKTQEAYRKGSQFVASLIAEDGSLNVGPHGLVYPVYSLAGAILVLSTPENEPLLEKRAPLLKRLRGLQLSREHGWVPEDLDFGGFSYFHAPPKKPGEGEPKHDLLSSNLTSTIFAVGALQLAGAGLEEPVFKDALQFVKRCQNYAPGETGPHADGGFFFTPSNLVQNKAGPIDGRLHRYRSYGTMTSDGVRALMRLGVPRSDPRVQAAAKWLNENFSADQVPGDFPKNAELLRASAYYYYVWTVSHALMLLGKEATDHGQTKNWAKRLSNAVLSRQRDDGSWSSSYVVMREDDPLVATPLAMAALAVARSELSGHFRTIFSQ